MDKYRAAFGPLKLSLVIFTGAIVHYAKCQSELKTVYFAKLTGVLQTTSVSGPEMTCSITSCAASCLPQNGCRLFSYNPTNEKCILGRPPDGPDSTHYATYRTVSAECPTNKGYVLCNSLQPPLCVRFDTRLKVVDDAQAACEEEGANLLRVKTLDIYYIVKDLLTDANYTDWVVIGADDRQTEGEFYWNDGTRLELSANVWNHATGEGYTGHEDCTALKTSVKIIDTPCFGYPRPFLCQIDVL